MQLFDQREFCIFNSNDINIPQNGLEFDFFGFVFFKKKGNKVRSIIYQPHKQKLKYKATIKKGVCQKDKPLLYIKIYII